MLTCKNCNKQFKTYVIVDGKKRCLTSRSNCLECSPFGAGRIIKPKIKKKRQNQRISDKCLICDKQIKGRGKYCAACKTKIRRHLGKAKAINLLGGKCANCGLVANNDNIAAFEFHHHDNNKEFTIGNIANRSWNVIKQEVMKCTLLCSNCHRIEHSNRNDVRFLLALQNYNGILK